MYIQGKPPASRKEGEKSKYAYGCLILVVNSRVMRKAVSCHPFVNKHHIYDFAISLCSLNNQSNYGFDKDIDSCYVETSLLS